jgi:membrane protease YdiL (CAAX protease family)
MPGTSPGMTATIESQFMDTLEVPADPVAPVPVIQIPRPPRVWKFWGTTLWGLLVVAAMFMGQLAVMAWLLWQEGSIDRDTVVRIASSGTTISVSVIMGLPATLAALWIAIRVSRTSFADYLALRLSSWTKLPVGIIAMVVLVLVWEAISWAAGSEDSSGFMIKVLQSARAEGTLWLLVIAFCVAAPITEEFLVRGFLYRGWSESFLHPAGAIVLSALAWTALHLQYDHDWVPFGEVFSIGLLLGYLRYRSGSIWLTVILHGLNNLAAVVQTMLLAGSSGQ